MKTQHQAPWDCVYAQEDKSECLPGKKPESDHEYFEILCLCILQAGLNWKVIRNNWAKYREGFCGFDMDQLSRAQAEEILAKPNVLRNRRKVEAIIHNAQEFSRIREEYGPFAGFLESLVGTSDEELLRVLSERFKHVGGYTVEYYLHSVGYWE